MNLVDDSNSLQRARKKVRVGSIRVVSSLLASVTLVGALTLGISWKFVHGVAQAVTPIASSAELQTLSTPIINARRNPETLSHDVRFRSLQTQLTLLSKRLPAESCLIIDIEGTRLVSVNPDIPLLPASNMKVVVAMVALDVLTPDFVFSTSLIGKANGNAIDGDAYLVGGGDPVLVTGNYPVTEPYPTFNFTRLENLFDALAQKGITRIGGSIIGDESRYDAERFSPSLGLGIKGTEVGPLGALMVNDGVVSGNPIKPDNPALGAATEFTNTLQNNGIAVSGSPKVGTAPQDLPVIARIDSLPLSDIIAEMLTNSDNNTAELLVKEIGFAVSGVGSREAGLEAMKAKLVEWGIPLDVLQFFDGSGLDRGNRLTCNTLMTLLTRDGGFGPVGLGLATANQTGTLREVLADTLGAGKLRGKTGTLTGAKALSGFVPFSADQASTFSLIINSPNAANQTTYRPIWNALSDALGGFSGSPTASEIAPNLP
jgi:D-alanyl-D-alanine carboxypeptidase/D-alanyl-D-alanine-endopeptidase (penicillin-binding protein 4)